MPVGRLGGGTGHAAEEREAGRRTPLPRPVLEGEDGEFVRDREDGKATMALGRAVAGGAVGGAVGAALMLPVFVGAKRAGLLRELPPNRVVDRATDAAARETGGAAPVPEDEPARAGAMIGSHVFYGAAAGGGYGALRFALGLPGGLAGPAFGLLLWAIGYVGWLPAAGILPRPWDQDAGDAWSPVAAHLVYGLALGLVEERTRR